MDYALCRQKVCHLIAKVQKNRVETEKAFSFVTDLQSQKFKSNNRDLKKKTARANLDFEELNRSCKKDFNEKECTIGELVRVQAKLKEFQQKRIRHKESVEKASARAAPTYINKLGSMTMSHHELSIQCHLVTGHTSSMIILAFYFVPVVFFIYWLVCVCIAKIHFHNGSVWVNAI
jgi:hypothetical protein